MHHVPCGKQGYGYPMRVIETVLFQYTRELEATVYLMATNAIPPLMYPPPILSYGTQCVVL